MTKLAINKNEWQIGNDVFQKSKRTMFSTLGIIMKRITIYFIFCFPFTLFGQHLIPDFPPYRGNVEKVFMNSIEYSGFDSLTETHIKSNETIWNSEYEFIDNNKPSRSISYYKKEIRSDKIYEYDTIGKRIFIKELTNDSVNNYFGNYSLKERIYLTDKREKIVRYNIWAYRYNIDSLYLNVLIKEIKYDSLNNLISFNQYIVDYKNDTIMHGAYELTYDSLSQLIYYDKMAYDSMTILANSDTDIMYRPKMISIQEPVLLSRIRFVYNEKGLMYKKVHEFHAKEVYLTDEGYSDYYEFDEKNNWIRLYRKRESQTDYNLSFERKIIYK